MAGLGSGQSDPVQATQEAAERAKVAARQSAAWLREEAGRLYTSYQQQSKYFKWRAWIVASFSIVALISMAEAFGHRNTLNAHLFWNYDSEGKLLTNVTNESADDWTHVKLILNDVYEFERDRLPAGQSATPNATQFRKPGVPGLAGQAPRNATVQKLRVVCDQGEWEQESQ